MGRSGILAALLLAVSASPLTAMGGGYGGGGFSMMHPAAKFDDYSMAVRLINHEKYADAIPYLDRALEDRPHSADILNYLGYTHRMIGDYPASLSYYQKALAEDPDHKGAHEYLGELYLNMHDVVSAQGQLAELARLCPSDCDERDMLTKKIADYQTAAAAAAPGAPGGGSPVAPASVPSAAPSPAAPASSSAPATPPAQPASRP